MADRGQTTLVYDSSGQIDSTGSANAYVIRVSEQISAYHRGMAPIRFKANFGNSGSATANIATELSPSGLGAVTMKKGGGASDLASGDIVSGGVYTLIYDGTFFQVLELNAAAVAVDDISNAQLADMVQATIKGRAAAAGTGSPQDLTAAQVLTILGALSSVNIQAFTASGTYTPTTGMKSCIVFSTGGGGGGGGADTSATSGATTGAGGAAGGTCIELFSAATIGASQAVTIGAGGSGGANTGGNGNAGGNTTFGALHTANGGSLGTGSSGAAVSAQPGSAGGVPSGGLVNITGGDGGIGIAYDANNGVGAFGGHGGASFWGGGGRAGRIVEAGGVFGSTAGTAGSAYGAGGGGAASVGNVTGATGGAGAGGVCVVIEFI